MKLAHIFCLVIAGLVLSGCEVVYTEQPLGEEITVLDKETWQGTWLNEDVVLMTTVLDAEKGLLQVAWLERGEEGAEAESFAGFVRHTGDWIFLNMEDLEDEGEGDPDSTSEGQTVEPVAPEFFWARVENTGKRAILWWPNVDQIRMAVNEGTLPGVVKADKNVRLAPLDETHLELINSPAANLLNWAQPDYFIRVVD